MTQYGVILAAGQGARMGALGERYPKCLLPVGDQPLIAHQLELMRRFGVEEVILVIGHLGQAIRDALGEGTAYGLRLHYVEQRQREGIAAAVGLLRDRLDEPFLLLLGDSYYECSTIDAFIDRITPDTAAILSVKEESDPEAIRRNFCVECSPSGQVTRVEEKPAKPRTPLNGCGMYWFSPALFAAIDATPRSALRNEYEITDAIQTLIDSGHPVYAGKIMDCYVNLTTPEDLIAANRRWLRQQGRASHTGAACTIATETALIETVVGDKVRIDPAARYERCVILPETSLNDGRDHQDQVLF